MTTGGFAGRSAGRETTQAVMERLGQPGLVHLRRFGRAGGRFRQCWPRRDLRPRWTKWRPRTV